MDSQESIDQKGYSCSHCNKEFKTLILFNRHKKTHNSICEKCNQAFKTFSQLRQHNKEKHPKLKFYKCKVCPDLTFTLEKEFLLHLRNVHEGKIIESHMCNVCGKTFRTSSELTLHIRSKCGTEKQFICKECGQKLMSPGSLYTHLKRHKGENTFMCRYCAKLFLTSGQLKVHERIHTQQKVFVCDVCGKGFCHRQSLITHLSLHTGIKPYQCEGCGKSFSCVGNLLKHRRTHTDSCGAIPMTSHRVQNPSTKIKVRINTPASSKLKRMQMKKELEEKFANLETETKHKEKDKVKCVKNKDVESDQTNTEEEKHNKEEESEDSVNGVSDSESDMSENYEEDDDFCEEKKSIRRRKRRTVSVQEEDLENFIEVRKLSKGKTAMCKYCKKEYSNFRWLFKHEQEHEENNFKEKHIPGYKCAICQTEFKTQIDLKAHQEDAHVKELSYSWGTYLQNGLQGSDKEDLLKRYTGTEFIMKYDLHIQNNIQKQICCGLTALDKFISGIKDKEESKSLDFMNLIDSAKIFADLYYFVAKSSSDGDGT